MEIIINTVMVICFINAIWWLIANVSGPLVWKVFAKLSGIVGVMFPILYLLIKLGVI